MIRLRGTFTGRAVPAFLLALVLPFSAAAAAELSAETASGGRIRLWLGGDVHFGNAAQNPLLQLRPITNDGLGIINLEGPVHEPADTIMGNKVLRLFNAPRTLGYLSTLNVKVAAVANNHQDDAGAAGKEQTERTVQEAGIVPVGGSSAAVLYRAGGYRLAIASYALSGPMPAGLTVDLVRLRKESDMLIVLLHSEGNPGYLPSARLRQAVETAVRAGAGIVASHGSHAVGPVERRGNTVIAWGLGNLAFNCACTDEREAILLAVELDPARKDGPISSSCVIPIHAGMRGLATTPAADAAAIFDLLEALGSPRLDRRHGRACF